MNPALEVLEKVHNSLLYMMHTLLKYSNRVFTVKAVYVILEDSLQLLLALLFLFIHSHVFQQQGPLFLRLGLRQIIVLVLVKVWYSKLVLEHSLRSRDSVHMMHLSTGSDTIKSTELDWHNFFVECTNISTLMQCVCVCIIAIVLKSCKLVAINQYCCKHTKCVLLVLNC